MDAAQGGRLAAGTLAGVAVSSPLFPRAAVIRRVNGEGALLLGGGRALLMQIAHPRVAQGVADHSDFQRDPFRRLQGTLDAMVTIVFGTEAQAREMAAVVGAVHDRVTGPGYKANDPELLWWVYATLIDTAVRMHARFVRPLTRREAERFYDESRVVAQVLGVPEPTQQRTLPEFQDYVRHMVGTLEVSDTARELSRAILRPGLPGFVVVRQLTAGLTPRPLREQFGLRWDAPRKAALLAAGLAARQVLPRVPAGLRRIPVAA